MHDGFFTPNSILYMLVMIIQFSLHCVLSTKSLGVLVL